MLTFFDTFGPIIQTGAVGAMLIVMIRWIKAKDRKSYELIEQMNQERRDIYESQKELIREATQALTDKNNTDQMMSHALEKLTEELRRLRENPQ